MNLGVLKAIVNGWGNDSYEFQSQTFMNPHSYRGYYNELAFEYCDDPLTVANIKQFIHEASTETFIGWKGGEYTYDDNTPVHLSLQGDANDEEGYDFTELVLAMDREYSDFNPKVYYNTPMQTNTETKMATKRKTAAQKRAEAEALRLQELQEEEAKFVATYQTRLLKLVHVFVREFSRFLSTSLDEAYEFQLMYKKVVLPFELSKVDSLQTVMDHMADIEYDIETSREAERKERERVAKKSAALAKLTEEERELLGL
jgi:hypothetical protein